jgi:hypothetical protein
MTPKDELGRLRLHCVYPNCKILEYPWCRKHDLWKFRRNARQVFGWSDKDNGEQVTLA